MKLSYVALLSDDVPAAVRFWSDVMRLPLIYSDETIGYAAFDTGSTGLVPSIYSRSGFAMLLDEAVPVPTGRQMYLSFPVDDVDAAYAELIGRGAHGLCNEISSNKRAYRRLPPTPTSEQKLRSILIHH